MGTVCMEITHIMLLKLESDGRMVKNNRYINIEDRFEE